MDNVIPSRFGLIVYLCAAVMLGLVLDHAYRTVLDRPRRSLATVVLAWCAGIGVACVALVPIGTYFADGLPLTTQKVQLPEWFRTVAPNLPAKQVLLVFPYAFRQSNMTWQAVDRMSFAMVGGGGPNSLPSRAGKERDGARYLSNVSIAGGPQDIGPGEVAAVRAALDGWGVTGVVFPDPAVLPSYEQVYLVRTAVVLMTAATGQLPEYRGRAWVWTGVDSAPPGHQPHRRPAECLHRRSAQRYPGFHRCLRRLHPCSAGRPLNRPGVRRGAGRLCVRRTGPSRGEPRDVPGESTSRSGRSTRAWTAPSVNTMPDTFRASPPRPHVGHRHRAGRGPGRDPGGRSAPDHGLPLRRRRHDRRLRRRRCLLRPVRLPDHRPVAGGVGPGGPHQARGLLAAPGPPAVARIVGGAGGGHPGRPLRLSGRALSQPAHGRPVGPVLLLQLVADRRQWQLLRRSPGRCRPSPTPGPWPSRSSSTWCGRWWCWPSSTSASGSTGASRSCWGSRSSGSSPRPSRWPCSTARGQHRPGCTSAPTPTPSPSWWGRCWPVSLTLIQRHRGLTGMAPAATGSHRPR